MTDESTVAWMSARSIKGRRAANNTNTHIYIYSYNVPLFHGLFARVEIVYREPKVIQGLENSNNGRLVESEQILAVEKLRKETDDALLSTHFLDGL